MGFIYFYLQKMLILFMQKKQWFMFDLWKKGTTDKNHNGPEIGLIWWKIFLFYTK